MPAPLTFAEMRAIERRHVCAVPGCGGELVLAWIGGSVLEGHYELQCGLNKEHRGYRRFRKEKPVNHITKLSIPKQKGENDDPV